MLRALSSLTDDADRKALLAREKRLLESAQQISTREKPRSQPATGAGKDTGKINDATYATFIESIRN